MKTCLVSIKSLYLQFVKKKGRSSFFNKVKKNLRTFGQFRKYIFLCSRFCIKHKLFLIMSRVCQLTGKRVMVGNHVSHSNIKTKRKFYPNLVKKKFYLPEEKEYITLRVSTSALRTINKNGITACVKEARAKGYLK